MSEMPHCNRGDEERRWLSGRSSIIAKDEELRTLTKFSDNSIHKFWRLTFVTRVSTGKKVAWREKVMKMQETEGVCTVEAGQCIQ